MYGNVVAVAGGAGVTVPSGSRYSFVHVVDGSGQTSASVRPLDRSTPCASRWYSHSTVTDVFFGAGPRCSRKWTTHALRSPDTSGPVTPGLLASWSPLSCTSRRDGALTATGQRYTRPR